ncbi:TRIP4 isoform 2, partial [Pan troglodytes]
ELRELRHASRLSKKVTIDFAGRKILEEENSLAEYHSTFQTSVKNLILHMFSSAKILRKWL